MNLTDQDRSEQDDELPTDVDPMNTWLTLVLIACVFVILVLGFISIYRYMMDEKTLQVVVTPQ